MRRAVGGGGAGKRESERGSLRDGGRGRKRESCCLKLLRGRLFLQCCLGAQRAHQSSHRHWHLGSERYTCPRLRIYSGLGRRA
eukprot:3941939-Rhodomonas_salina.2